PTLSFPTTVIIVFFILVLLKTLIKQIPALTAHPVLLPRYLSSLMAAGHFAPAHILLFHKPARDNYFPCLNDLKNIF
ncbi:MAG: hypothetical protein ACOCNL_10840, partial [Acetivibrio ethanolgignens]